MTRFAHFSEQNGSNDSHSSASNDREVQSTQASNFAESLRVAIADHLQSEAASFHFPGHKGRIQLPRSLGAGVEKEPALFNCDVTELPTLDDLADPQGVLKSLSIRASRLWQSQDALLSVSGASAGNIASILACAALGTHVLVPRNAHRSVINALIIGGLSPVWYEPVWDAAWQVWGAAEPEAIKQALNAACNQFSVAAVLVTSPTYAGAISDIRQISRICADRGVPLIVDEAHGAHLLPSTAVLGVFGGWGADLVVHSLHKTLGALTQCGSVQVGVSSPLSVRDLQNAINLVQSSSPSYPLMVSIESAIEQLEGEAGVAHLARLVDLSHQLRVELARIDGFVVYQGEFLTDPLHILIAHKRLPSPLLQSLLIESGIYPESILGKGLLFVLGVGSNQEDVDRLLDRLRLCAAGIGDDTKIVMEANAAQRPVPLEQVFAPREAWLMPSSVVSREEATDQIVADYFAPCPPGIPICVPGQRLEKGVISDLPNFVRIVS